MPQSKWRKLVLGDVLDEARIHMIATAVRHGIERCKPSELPWETFPRGACGDTSLVLGQVLRDAGIGGFVYICGNKYRTDGNPYSHGWLQNDQWVVDITADQFAEVEQKVIVSNNSEWHKHWELERPQPSALVDYGIQGVVHLWRLHAILTNQLKFWQVFPDNS
ncbi:hypothetical protein [Duganella sp. HH105]|uniref:hypothetical protein n=1 Tax=Duganella sp. HH105 TaxID=1781067 RepID=UPI00114CD7A7|nr:hypothetical protein [Duganella sp. HH105]